METTRQKKISNLVQQDMAEIFREVAKNSMKGVLITVTKVKVTPDLAIARIYLSLFPVDNKEALLSEIRENTSHFRNLLGQRTRHQLRVIPELEFYIDDSLDYIDNIEKELRGEGENPLKD